MYIFLGESGDLGFDYKNKRPSKYFVITCLVCKEKVVVNKMLAAVKKTLKNKLNHGKSRFKTNELKGSKTFFHVKRYLYKQICAEKKWSLHSIVLDKESFSQHKNIKINVRHLYNNLVQTLISEVVCDSGNKTIELVIDKCMNNAEIAVFNQMVWSKSKRVRIDHIASHKHAVLQVVDMFSWGIYRRHEYTDFESYNFFSSRIVSERVITKETAPVAVIPQD